MIVFVVLYISIITSMHLFGYYKRKKSKTCNKSKLELS
jgi:hypothetical protein